MPVMKFARFTRGMLIVLALLQPAMTRATVVATVRGIVHDPDHRPVPGAQAVVKATNSDYSQKLATDVDGRFEAAAVPVGSYIVTVTKDGFAAAFRGFAGNVRIESKHDIHEIYASGDLAYCRSHISVVVTAAKTGERNERSGHVLTVFRKSADGEWRLARDANLIGGTAG